MHFTKMTTAKKTLVPKQRPKVIAGAAGMRDATVRMKRVVGGGSALKRMGQDGEATHENIVRTLALTDHTHNARGTATVPLEIEKEAIAEIVGGASPAEIETKYQLAKGYVSHALKRRFGSQEAAFAALQGLTLEVALACNVHALTQVEHMSGPQAVMSGAIATDKALALQKAIQDRPKTIDFGQLAEMGKVLKVLREISTPTDS